MSGTENKAGLGWALTLLSLPTFCGVCYYAWEGKLGLIAIGLLLVSAVCFFFGQRNLSKYSRKLPTQIAKLLFTVAGMMALLRHPIPIDDETKLPIYEAIIEYLPQVDAQNFFLFACIAMAVKFVGVLPSSLCLASLANRPRWT